MEPNASPKAQGLSGIPFKRLVFFALLFVILSGAGIYVVASQFADQSVKFDPRLFSSSLLIWVALLLAVYYGADGLRLHFTLRALGHSLPLRKIFRLVFINIFFSNVTPMATGGGLAQIWYLQRHGVPLGTATAATTIRTVLAVAFIFVITPFALVLLDALQGKALIDQIGIYLAFFITAYLGFFAVVLLRTRWLLPPLTLILNGLYRCGLIDQRRHRHWSFKSKREMLRFARSFVIYRSGPKPDIALSILSTVVFLLALFSFPALLINALGYAIDYPTVVGLLAVTTFVMYFAPTPGASGVAEGVFGHLFSGLISGNHLVLVTVAWRLLTIYLGMAIGLVVTQLELMRTRSKPGET